jgi:tRNA (cytidine/uridine-2'-O-)-methyltransferase
MRGALLENDGLQNDRALERPGAMTNPEDTNLLRLRAGALVRPFHVVLVEPEIPPNTGNIARLCAATNSVLHLVGRLGFSIDEHAVRRAGLDYWHLVDLRQHDTLEQAEQSSPNGRTWLFSGKSSTNYLSARFQPGDRLIFGKESVGLPESLLHARSSEVIAIPTLGQVRSLNLANAVSIALYEALRQVGALTDTSLG